MNYALVTGRTGFVGRAIRQALVREGWRVRSTGRGPLQGQEGEEYLRGDLREAAFCNQVVQGVNAVVHSAGLAHQRGSAADRSSFMEVNAELPRSLARACGEGVKDFVLISSVSVYGRSAGELRSESSPCKPENAYGESKLQGEQAVLEIARDKGLRVTVLRLGTVYGEGDPGNVARLVRAVDSGKFRWVGKGGNRKSMVFHEDAASACVKALSRRGDGAAVYNISGPPVTMKAIVEEIASGLGRQISRLAIPASLARAGAWTLSALCAGRGPGARLRHTVRKWLEDEVFSGEKAAAELAWAPQVSIQEGIRREIAWYRAAVENP